MANIDKKAQVEAIVAAPSCCAELREAASAYLAAMGTNGEKAAAKILIAELEEDVMPVDHVIGFFGSDAGVQVFGAEKAAELLAHSKEIKAAGAVYCDCPACAAGAAVLAAKDEYLA